METDDRKVVILLSGGLDSTVMLADAVQKFGAHNVTALTLFYGQRHDKELESAKAIAAHFGVNHLIRDLADVFELDNNPMLRSSDQAMPEGDYATQQKEAGGIVKTYVPFRNGLFLSYAAAIAYSIGASIIAYGAHADDAAGNAYPDCSSDFYKSMSRAVILGTGGKVELHAPLIDLNKADIVAYAIKNAPVELTWSCYVGKELACGTCGTCVDRLNAFKAVGVTDPIPYAPGIKASDSAE